MFLYKNTSWINRDCRITFSSQQQHLSISYYYVPPGSEFSGLGLLGHFSRWRKNCLTTHCLCRHRAAQLSVSAVNLLLLFLDLFLFRQECWKEQWFSPVNHVYHCALLSTWQKICSALCNHYWQHNSSGWLITHHFQVGTCLEFLAFKLCLNLAGNFCPRLKVILPIYSHSIKLVGQRQCNIRRTGRTAELC